MIFCKLADMAQAEAAPTTTMHTNYSNEAVADKWMTCAATLIDLDV